MMKIYDTNPHWGNLSHHEKYLQLHQNRITHCNNQETLKDVSGGEYFLDGRFIKDVPSFYLSLGEAINGECGYFGTCLDSLNDCLSGGFGIVPPFALNIINGVGVEKSLNELAWIRMRLENRLSLFEVEEPDLCLDKDGMTELGVFDEFSLTGVTFYKAIYKLFEEHGIKFKLYD